MAATVDCADDDDEENDEAAWRAEMTRNREISRVYCFIWREDEDARE